MDQKDSNLQGNDRYKVSIKVLRRNTKDIICCLLRAPKISKSEKGYMRNWQGLAELCGIPGQRLPSLGADKDQCNTILDLWYDGFKDEATVEQFLHFLEELERYDVIDDIQESLEADIEYHKKYPNGFKSEQPNLHADKFILTVDDVERIKQGLPPQNYDGFVLFADEDIDFATELMDKIEKEYQLKLCTKDRDLVGGAFEHDSIIQLISERCGRLIVIVSPSFLDSNANKFFYSFAQAISIEQRNRKIVPCMYKKCDILPPELRCYHMLDFTRSERFYNFWDKLYSSIKAPEVKAKNPQIKDAINRVGRSASQYESPLQKQARTPPKSALHNISSNTLKPMNQTVKFNSVGNIPEATNTELNKDSTVPSTSANSLDVYPAQRPKKPSFYKKVKNLLHKGPKENEATEKTIENGQCQNAVAVVNKKKIKLWGTKKRKVALAN